jgi:hypothetical protein
MPENGGMKIYQVTENLAQPITSCCQAPKLSVSHSTRGLGSENVYFTFLLKIIFKK